MKHASRKMIGWEKCIIATPNKPVAGGGVGGGVGGGGGGGVGGWGGWGGG